MSQKLDAGLHALREALYELSMAKEVPDKALLDDLVRRYPQLGEEITEYAVALAIDAVREREVAEAEQAIDFDNVSPMVQEAMQQFQDRLFPPQSTAGPAAPPVRVAARVADPPNPFSSLDRRGFRALAERLHANPVFVCKLRDRQIDPDTIPLTFQQRVADELETPLELVQAHFAARQSMQGVQYFKADAKPVVGAQQSFEEAVRSSDLTEEQQDALLKT
jgi:hypothetical protein